MRIIIPILQMRECVQIGKILAEGGNTLRGKFGIVRAWGVGKKAKWRRFSKMGSGKLGKDHNIEHPFPC